MSEPATVEEVESFVRSYDAYLYVNERHDGTIRVKGTFDDLNPEPERTKIDNVLSRIRINIIRGDDIPFTYESVSNVNTRYSSKFIDITV